MKILIVQEAGRHAANREFRESLCFSRALRRSGLDTVVWGLGYSNYAIPFAEIAKDCDACLLLENYDETGWLPDLGSFGGPIAFLSVDSHCSLDAHLRTCRQHNVRLVLCATRGHMRHFEAPGRIVRWMPSAYDHHLIRPLPEVPKIHDLGFCGNYVNRRDWIDRLTKEHRLHQDIFVIGPDMVRAVNGYRIAFNRNMADDVNYRTFEVPGCRTLLLTNYTPDLELHFRIGEEVVVYDDWNDCRRKVDHLLAHPDERERIAEAGHRRALSSHTFDHRARLFIEYLRDA